MTLEANDRAQHSAVTRPDSLSSLDITPVPNKAGETRVAQLSGQPNIASDAPPSAAATAGAVGKGAAAGFGADLRSTAIACGSEQFRGMDNSALQSEVNAIMAKDGYVFKDATKGAAAVDLAKKHDANFTYKPNPNFDDTKDLSAQDKELLGSLQAAKAFNNYPGKDACTSITDPAYRQHGKNELLPASMNKELAADDIKKMGTDGVVSMDQVRAARNEIFMRAGRPFVDANLAKFGIEQGYKPRLNFNETTDMTKIEKGNAKLLLGVEGYMREHKMQNLDSATLDSVVTKLKGH
ncbi:MAG TPA: hypothetical protein V6D22_23770 [Candidatus Obscuribacterales bacterium]